MGKTSGIFLRFQFIFSSHQNLLEDKTALGQLNTKANALAKTLIKALREQKLLPQSLEEKLTHLNDINTR